ncbi:class I adenylate-forming enzyme family protein [Kribbella kalugense]|uniref:Acyl-CoA synthetase (AMP-forming)/AMP-acid ligase II n=1 Tax=Kribbella kalugense TaxID=2512221 RepID=A0A4V3G6X1_9ACTN|nr:AMP-binding protein [Kribbella kalugense]TDW17024.1 acyl-CoA synthetase (AMP-forming)/AMP-acid ligase II [Kribbella kalugense]
MPPEFALPENSSNYAVQALRRFQEYSGRPALARGNRSATYGELIADVLRFAAAFRDAGVRPGGKVLVMAANCFDAPALQLALHLHGCRVLWSAPITSRREIDRFAALADADAFVYDDGALGEELAASLAPMPAYRIADLDAQTPYQILETPAPDSVLQTSGTTGDPKLVHHTQAFYKQILDLAAVFVAQDLPLLRHYSGSPLWLASGQITTFFNLFTGGVLFLTDTWSPDEFYRIVPAERITSTYVTPPMLYELLDHPGGAGVDCSSLFMLNVGAGPATPTRLLQGIERFGPVLRIVYGLSECVVVTAQPGLTKNARLASAGTPYGDVVVEIRDDDGKVLPAGDTGEVWVQSKLVFAEYVGMPELTAETLVDGWLRTRDVGYVDDDGFLFLVDRVHDMIVTTRRNWAIFCRPIEDVLGSHPAVRTAAVIGVPDPVVGEAVHAFVVTRSPVTALELQDLVTATLNEMWTPAAIDFVDELPLTQIAKVDKVALRKLYAELHPQP